jgi:hypothetical protein
MQSHGPKRVYTPHSLEFWFGKLENDWSERFSSSQLEVGRQIYRDGQVRELELTVHDAIVHRRVDKKDEYAVIEWSSEGFSVRSSTTDTELAHALAVAGLHEIEELVADEISPLPEDLPAPVLVPAPPVTARTMNRSFVAGNGHPPARPHVVPAARLSATSRPLLLVFKTKTAGLTFQAFWVEADKKTRHPALGPDAHTNGTASYTLTRNFTSDRNVVAAKIGIFNAVSGGTLCFETMLDATADLKNGDTIQIVETVTL